MTGKVFGIGLSRTGTKSLAGAMNMLGVRTKWYPQDQQTYVELITGKYRLSILQNYDALTDVPVAPFFPQLDETYPGSRFILTVRDKAHWLSSCAKHYGNCVTGPIPAGAPFWQKYASFISTAVYGCNAFEASRFSWVYDRHVESVRSYFADRPDDLLELDVSSPNAWQQLHSFLGLTCEVPTGSFPKINDFQSPLLG